MNISFNLFEAFLKCPTKCWLRATGEPGSGNGYAEWVKSQTESYRAREIERLLSEIPKDESSVAPKPANLKTDKWRLAVDVVAQASTPAGSGIVSLPGRTRTPGGTPSQPADETSALPAQPEQSLLETHLHAIERIPSEGRGRPAQFVSIRFIYRNKLTKDDRLLMAFDAFVLSQMLGREVGLGKIIHGDDHASLKVKVASLTGEVRKRIEKMAPLLADPKPPDLVLNRHCAECEFRDRCRQKAIETDDLSLLAGMSAKERQKLRSKGIFTVTQLSYTFRPRRRPRRLRDKREKYYHSLKALAIREKKIHIVGSPELKIDGTPVYLDVEGSPDRDFYYLIGLRIGNGDSAVQHSLWADTVEDEGKIWREFLAILETVEKPVLIHYGSYETIFLNQMQARHCSPPEESAAAKAITTSVNVISVVYAQVYFPTITNGLKDLAQFLGFKWTEANPSGLRVVTWRSAWEKGSELPLREKLLAYNSEDCQALEILACTMLQLSPQHASNVPIAVCIADAVHAESIPRESLWGKFSTPIFEFEQINKTARWDYQQDRVYLRIHGKTRAADRRRVQRCRSMKPNGEITIQRPTACPLCRKKGRSWSCSRILYDLRFTKYGVRRSVVRYAFHYCWCDSCRKSFGRPDDLRLKSVFGTNVVSLIVYMIIELGMAQKAVSKGLNGLFKLGIHDRDIHRLKTSASRFYESTRQQVLSRMIAGSLINVDETTIILRGKRAYVWVFTTFREVAYFYSEGREASFVQTKLQGFSGILVSDFYAAYDSIPCAQQKCLIHLMRDLNDAVLAHPYDEEVKGIVTGFASPLKSIVETIDRRGLKSHFLRKHIVDVERFYRQLSRSDFQSEAASKCRERFEKNREKLFTFLNYDGVPWNNNNAEHAIKAFARLRRSIEGLSTPKGIDDYLILLSICQTCKYMGVDFLDFLRSGRKDIYAFAESRRRRRRQPGFDRSAADFKSTDASVSESGPAGSGT